jgi:hypothetical protein
MEEVKEFKIFLKDVESSEKSENEYSDNKSALRTMEQR